VIVSASLRAYLDPLAAVARASSTWCTDVERDGGRYTITC
jgi:hypothetical protein